MMEQLNLFENAIDSLQHGIEHLQMYDDGLTLMDAKQAIMNLINALDLLVLERLRRIDENAIYDKSQGEENEYGYRPTISAGAAYKKISKHLERPIDGEELEAYNVLKILRNSATHYKFVFGEERMENIEFILHYIARFLEEDLDEELTDYLQEESYKVYLTLIEGKEYGDILQNRAEEVRKELLRSEIAWNHFRSVKDGGESPVMEWPCDECGEDGVSNDKGLGEIGVCVFCEAKHEFAECPKCEYVMNLNYEGGYFCDSCTDWIDNQ